MMKISRLFVIGLLAGTLAVIGCGNGEGNGNGGTGGTAGTGGSDLTCMTAQEVCANCDSTEQARIDACESAYDTCIANPPSGPADEVQEKCTVFALSRCGL